MFLAMLLALEVARWVDQLSHYSRPEKNKIQIKYCIKWIMDDHKIWYRHSQFSEDVS